MRPILSTRDWNKSMLVSSGMDTWVESHLLVSKKNKSDICMLLFYFRGEGAWRKNVTPLLKWVFSVIELLGRSLSKIKLVT